MLDVMVRKLASEVGPRKKSVHQRWFSGNRRQFLDDVREQGVEQGRLMEADDHTWYAVDPATGLVRVPPRVGESTESAIRGQGR